VPALVRQKVTFHGTAVVYKQTNGQAPSQLTAYNIKWWSYWCRFVG